MNAELLLEHYNRVADAPQAVSYMRGLILDLAFSGKLAHQDDSEESAGQLLMATAQKSEKGKTDALDLPPGWISVPLGSAANITMGQSPPGSTYNTSGEGVPLINGPVEFSPGPFGLTKINQFTSAPTKFCHEGDLLICVRGSTTGRTNIAAFDACIGRGVAAIKPKVNERFVHLFVHKNRDYILGLGRGIAFPSVSRHQLTDMLLPTPPLAEQERIVSKVDELMAICDQLEAARAGREETRDRLAAAVHASLEEPEPETFRENARFFINVLPELTARPDQIKQLRQAILDIAVQGKLVPQDPNDEPVDESLLGLVGLGNVDERITRRTTSGQCVRSIADAEKYLRIPHSWAWTRLSSLGVTQTGQTPPTSAPDCVGDFIPFVKPGDLTASETADSLTWLSEIGSRRSRIAKPESILMVCIGASLGKTSIVRRSVCFNQQINSITPYNPEMIDFLYLALQGSGFRRLAWDRAGTGTLPIISKGKWEQLPVPVPPISEQLRVVDRVKQLMLLLNEMESANEFRVGVLKRLLDTASCR